MSAPGKFPIVVICGLCKSVKGIATNEAHLAVIESVGCGCPKKQAAR